MTGRYVTDDDGIIRPYWSAVFDDVCMWAGWGILFWLFYACLRVPG